MSIYRNIALGFWNDSKVDEFETEDKLVFLYLLTNPLTTMCGCYEIGPRRVARDLGYDIETVRVSMERLAGFGVIEYDEGTREVLVVNWGRYNWTASPKIDRSIAESIEAVKSAPLRAKLVEIFENSRSIPYPYPIDTVSDTTAYPIDTVSDGEAYPMDTVSIPSSVSVSVSVSEEDLTESTSKVDVLVDEGWPSFFARCVEVFNDETGKRLIDAEVPADVRMLAKRAFENGRTMDEFRAAVRNAIASWKPHMVTLKAVLNRIGELSVMPEKPKEPERKRIDWPPSLPCPTCGADGEHVGGAMYRCVSCDAAWKAEVP